MHGTLTSQDITSERRCYHCSATIGRMGLAAVRDEGGQRLVTWTCVYQCSPSPALTSDQVTRLDAILAAAARGPMDNGLKHITEYIALG